MDKYEITRETIIDFIKNKSEFTRNSLTKEILKNDGLLYTSPNIHFSGFLEDLVNRGNLSYSPKDQTYTVLQKLF